MTLTQMMAELLCNKQPYPIRYRLLKNEGFILKYDLKPSAGVTIAKEIHLNQQALIVGVKRLLTKKEIVQIPDAEGKTHTLSIEQDHIFFKSASKEIKTPIDIFFILSPDRDERVKKLNELVAAMGPMSSDFSQLIADSENHELSYEQVDKLIHEFYNGVAALQDVAQHAFKSHQATLENLVPNSLSYYDYFCGPDPGGVGPEEYLGSTLPVYRKELIKKNFIKGLDVCLQGALRDDLMPGLWINGHSDDEVWEGLQVCDSSRDPFALLGALDIAMWRQKDDRFIAFIDDSLEKLVKENFLRADEIDMYELMPSLAGLILNRINVIEGGGERPPYWKRMCAWMQAGFLMRHTQRLKLNFESLKDWISANMVEDGDFAKLIDLRREPMHIASEMTRSAFRGEIIGRLLTMRKRHEENGRHMPKPENIDSAVSVEETKSTPFCWALPGPLEGHVLASKHGRKIAEETKKHFCENLFSDEFENLLPSLSYLSQLYVFDEELLTKIREAINNVYFNDKFTGFPSILMRIIDAGIIASAQQDKELSRIIGSKIVSATSWINTEFSVGTAVQALLFAGAAFQEENDWVNWIQQQLVEVAYRLSPGDQMKEFLFCIKKIKKVTNLKTSLVSKAEAIASAAV